MYKWIEIGSSAGLSKLVKAIPSQYAPKTVADKLKDGISNAVKSVLIEYDYIDKDYRSTYYNFYAKKGRHYDDKCVRLHFFDESVQFNESVFEFSGFGNRLEDHYFGYMVLRPTGSCTIGRSVVSPDVRNGVSGFTITAKHKVHLLGYELIVQGFPSMDQHNDISVCAHAACWSILRHYSERYEMHKEFLVHDITMMAQYHDPGGLVPSRGLDISHAERVFQEAGTYPVNVTRQDESEGDDKVFYRQLIAYVESGVPLFAANHSQKHAFAVVGFERREPIPLASAAQRSSWEELKSLIVIDDNHLPYLAVSANDSVEDMPYRAEDIDAFIVPLPEKVHYPADAVDVLAHEMRVLEPVIKFPDKDEAIIRYFMTTGSALRRFVRSHKSEFDPELLKLVMTRPFAQFLWVVEYATSKQWAAGQIGVRAVIDATASHQELLPLWLIHDRTNALVFNRHNGNFKLGGLDEVPLNGMTGTALTRMDQNVRPIQTK